MHLLKDIAELLKDAVEITAVIVGGIWTYWLFVQKRERWPKADLKHRICSWPISGDRQLIRIGVDIKNVGEVLLEIRRGFTEVYQLKPWPNELTTPVIKEINFRHPGGTEFKWAKLAFLTLDGKPTEKKSANEEWPEPDGYDIEPGENEELFFDFIIPAGVELVSVYSRTENALLANREFGWNLTTIFNTTTQTVIAETVDDSGDKSKNKP